MAAYDAPQIDLGLRSEALTEGQIGQIERDAAHHQQQRKEMLTGIVVGLLLLLLFAGLAAAWHRRRLVRALDSAAVAGLASGIRTGRAVRAKIASLAERAAAKADDHQ